MSYTWTDVQRKRLGELSASEEERSQEHESKEEREAAFEKIQSRLGTIAKEKLRNLREGERRSTRQRLEEELAYSLREQGFVQVTTPTMLSKSMLEKMTINDSHALHSQVFWLDKNKCLRPMLAPNLYYVLKDLLRLWEPPVRIFEIGSCFRKESQGSHHLNEFTMLNLVEWGLPEGQCSQRLRELAGLVMDTAQIDGWELEAEDSVVYGDTIDVVYKGLELGSGAMGPHVLDGQWGLSGPWVGLGVGLERLAMVKEGGSNVKSTGKSLSYMGGVRLNV